MPRIVLAFDQGTLLLTGAPAARAKSVTASSRRGESSTPPAAPSSAPAVPSSTPGMGLQWDERVGAWRAHAVSYPSVRKALARRFGADWLDAVPAPEAVRWPAVSLPALRSEQTDALSAWHAAGRRGLVVMPTGTGKTEVALAAMRDTAVATLVVAPIRDLMYQWHRRIQAGLGYDAGIVGDNLYNLRPVTVTTYDSATIHMPKLGGMFGLLVFDEAHHLPGKMRREAALLSTARWRLGLTATPERADGAHADLASLVGPTVARISMASVKGRSLAHYSVVRVPVTLSPAEQAIYDEAAEMVRRHMARRRGDNPRFTWRQLLAEVATDPEARAAQRAFYRKKSIEDRAEDKLRVLEDLFRLHFGERIIVFTGSNAMALDVSRRFLVPTMLNHSRKQERAEVLAGFESGRFPVLVANQVLDEGIDVPAAKIGIVVGGQSSTRQATQRLGRLLRPQGASQATLYEVVCRDTREEKRSRDRRRSAAYEQTTLFRVAEGTRLAYGRARHRRV